MNPTERFSNRADHYRRHRPGYPIGVLQLMRETCGLQSGARVADIGAGTGIFTNLLLDAGYDVTAIEPNAPMRQAMEEDLGNQPRFHSIDAPAEKTSLPHASFDAVTAAQAFHWFDTDAARTEFQRILRPGGWVFLIWNRRSEDATPFDRAYTALLHTLGDAYEKVRHRDSKAEAMSVAGFAANLPYKVAEFDNPHRLDWHGLEGRFLSSSYIPAKGEPLHDDLLSGLRRIYDQHSTANGIVFSQFTRVYYVQLT